jgi:hypothetical protein
MFCVNDRLLFWSAAFDLTYLAAVGAVGTVEKRSLFSTVSIAQVFAWLFPFQAAVRG